MSDPIAYVESDELKAALKIAETDDPDYSDEAIDALALAASRQVDDHCGRYFGQVGSEEAQVARSFPVSNRLCLIDDLVSYSVLENDTGSGSWAEYASTGLVFHPENAPTLAPAKPYDWVEIPSYRWQPERLRFTGVWGWPAVPSQVSRATFLQAIRLFKSPSVSLGVVGGADNMGVLRLSASLHPDARALLDPFVKVSIGG